MMHGQKNIKLNLLLSPHFSHFSSFRCFNRINIDPSFTECILRAEIKFIIKQIFICEIKYSFPCQIVLFVSEHKADACSVWGKLICNGANETWKTVERHTQHGLWNKTLCCVACPLRFDTGDTMAS